ncbi:hypothetical protein NXG04_07860 [Klebsiella pneumoniae]|nr:hypothetical protein [Klebsiella pneumoniae]MDS7714470.1 hypothetical protein [Klebsiella pneumoniae]UUV46355.1 hypothetical protein [Bacillus phage vB_BanS-Thrax2]
MREIPIANHHYQDENGVVTDGYGNVLVEIGETYIAGNLYIYAELKNPKWYHKFFGTPLTIELERCYYPHYVTEGIHAYMVTKTTYQCGNGTIVVYNPKKGYEYKIGFK